MSPQTMSVPSSLQVNQSQDTLLRHRLVPALVSEA